MLLSFQIRMKLARVFIFFAFLICCWEVSTSQDQNQDQDSNKPTKCDESIAKVMCDEFQNQIEKCAELMPEDEQQFFKECSEEMGVSTSDNWSDILVGLCSQDNPAQTSFDLVSCWDDKRNATLDQITDDKIYPMDHFMCKRKIYEESVEKTDCACKTEKGFDCGIAPGAGLG